MKINNKTMWGQVTASIDWCEENYSTFFALAEFYNAITNIPFIIGAIMGVSLVRNQGFETRFGVAYAMLGVVGIGSFLFHGTLLRTLQTFDEVPMVLTTCVMAYNSFLRKGNDHIDWKSREFGKLVGSVILYLSVYLSLYAIFYDEPLVHQILYTGFAIVMILQRLHVTERILIELPSLPDVTKGELQYMTKLSLISYVGASIFWAIDHHGCEMLREARQWLLQSPNLWWMSPLLQFHGWWHLFAAQGTFLEVGNALFVRSLFQAYQDLDYIYNKLKGEKQQGFSLKTLPSLRFYFGYFPAVSVVPPDLPLLYSSSSRLNIKEE